MSELKACPFCGSNDVEESDTYDGTMRGTRIVTCNSCGSGSLWKTWDRRVMQWVPVAERLPKKEGVYFILDQSVVFLGKINKNTASFNGKDWGEYYRPTHWLDDHTFDKEEK